jgi:hypothetical protein
VIASRPLDAAPAARDELIVWVLLALTIAVGDPFFVLTLRHC